MSTKKQEKRRFCTEERNKSTCSTKIVPEKQKTWLQSPKEEPIESMARQSKFTAISSSSKMLKEHKNPYIRLITKYQLKYKAVKAAEGT